MLGREALAAHMSVGGTEFCGAPLEGAPQKFAGYFCGAPLVGCAIERRNSMAHRSGCATETFVFFLQFLVQVEMW